MPSRTADLFSTIHAEGGLFTPDFLQLVLDQSREIEHTTPDSYRYPGMKLNEVVNQQWNVLNRSWQRFASGAGEQGYLFDMIDEREGVLLARDDADPGPLEGLTRQRWLMPLFQALDYGGLSFQRQLIVGERVYPVSHQVHHVPIHLVGASSHLDRRPTRAPRSASDNIVRTSPHATVQELLNRSDEHLWGFVGNGLRLRLLRDNVSLVRQAYVEFDLHAMMKGQVYPDFKLLWLLCHESRLHAERAEQSIMEQWRNTALQRGARALEKLRDGVERAINTLGAGFLKATTSPGNQRLRQRLRSGELSQQDYYRQLLRLVYRLLFLFVAEDRQLLFAPDVPADPRRVYEDFYSTRRLRELAARPRGSQHPDLWRGLQLVLEALGRDGGCPPLGLPGLGSFLFSHHALPDLDAADVSNRDLLRAIHHLAYVQDKHGRTPVNFTVLNEELGSVYESLLDLQPHLDADAATFQLRDVGGSERKTTGSYYTHHRIVERVLDSSLTPLLDEALQAPPSSDDSPTPQERILNLTICDPACGSGDFLIAAAHRLAQRLATATTGDDAPDPQQYRAALRRVIESCIYGVDVNELAVELCKVALWIESLQPGKPLAFLDHHIQHGNALIGAVPALLAEGIPDETFTAVADDAKSVCTSLRNRNADERSARRQKQEYMFESWTGLSGLPRAPHEVLRQEDVDVSDVQEKEEAYREFREQLANSSQLMLHDAWCAAFLWPKQTRHDQDDAITDRLLTDIQHHPERAVGARPQIQQLRDHYRFFHWHLIFDDVFREPGEGEMPDDTRLGWSGGFDLILGNPPWDTLSPDVKEFFSRYDPQIRFQAKDEQSRTQQRLLQNPDVAKEWDTYCQDLYRSAHFFKRSGRYRLFAPGNLGKGDFNIFRMFVETALDFVRPGGWVAQVVPDGMYGGANCMAIRKALFEEFRLAVRGESRLMSIAGGGR